MRLLYDDHKRQANLARHRLDFDDLDEAFFLSSKVVAGKAGRWMAIGEFKNEIIIVVVFAPLGTEALTIISMRPASRKERSIV